MPSKRPLSNSDAATRGMRSSGVISLHELYRLEEAKLRLGWSDAAYRAARRRGLAVIESGKRRYLSGQEIIRFLTADSSARG